EADPRAGAAPAEHDATIEQPGQQLDPPPGGPQLELGILAGRLRDDREAPGRERDVEGADDAEVCPVEGVRDPEDRGQAPHGARQRAGEGAQLGVRELRYLLAMAADGLRHRLHLEAREAEELRVADETAGVVLMALVIDRVADVVEERRVLEQLARRGPEPERGRDAIEELDREPRDLPSVDVRPRELRRESLDGAPAWPAAAAAPDGPGRGSELRQ